MGRPRKQHAPPTNGLAATTEIVPPLPIPPTGDASGPADEIQPRDTSPAQAPAEGKQRLSVPLTDDGRLDFDGMRDATAERLRAAIAADPQALRNLGIAQTPALDVVGISAVRSLYGIFGGLVARFAASKYPQLPAPAITIICEYNEDELGILAPPTAAVLNKYTGIALLKYREEMDLGLALIYVHQAKMQRLEQLSIQMMSKEQQ